MNANAYSKKNRPLGVVIAIIILVAAIIIGWLYMHKAQRNPLSEDAIIGANTVNVAATVAGRIISIEVKENQRVKKGDLLFTIDPKPLRLIVEQAAADLAIAEAMLVDQRRAISAEGHNAVIADEQIVRARTNLELTEKTLKRLEALAPQGYVTRQQVDDARTLRDDAQVSLRQANKQAQAATVLVGNDDGALALVTARQAALALAKHGLENSKVYAPNDGLVVGLIHGAGEIVIPGQSLFTLIDTSTWYASATFPETELGDMAIGNCASVRVLANNSLAIKGHVDGIGWGVSSTDLINVPRNLPYIPKSLNWVRIAQRFPVRIKLDNPPAELMRVGASADVTVHYGKEC